MKRIESETFRLFNL